MDGSPQGQSTPGFRKGAPLSLGSDSLPVPTVQQKDSLACASQPQFLSSSSLPCTPASLRPTIPADCQSQPGWQEQSAPPQTEHLGGSWG